MSLTLSDDAELAELNAAHMGKDGPTDVLSFPLLPPGAFPPIPARTRAVRAVVDGPAFALPPGEAVHLGDIIVSVERAVEQASRDAAGRPATSPGNLPTSCVSS